MKMDQTFNSLRSGQMNKESLNKYKKKVQKKPVVQNYKTDSSKRTLQSQFQKYFLDTTNVFFEDRDSLKQLESTNHRLRIILPLWFFLAITFAIVSKIHPFQGHCPQNATCKVFIRCNPGYQLSNDGLHCNVKASIIEQIENVCKFEIESLKLQYGDNDCLVNKTIQNTPPYKNIHDLEDSITKTLNPGLKIEIQKKIRAFLNNQTNQNIYEFSLINQNIVPLTKNHSFSCWIDLLSRTQEFKIFLIVLTLTSILLTWWFINHRREQKVKKIYEYLKQKVISQNKVNITLLSDEMKSIFGHLDQSLWIKVDEERKKDARIAYFEDQFLFWKLL